MNIFSFTNNYNVIIIIIIITTATTKRKKKKNKVKVCEAYMKFLKGRRNHKEWMKKGEKKIAYIGI